MCGILFEGNFIDDCIWMFEQIMTAAKKDIIIPPSPWREEHEYHTTTVEEQMPDTNLDREKL